MQTAFRYRDKDHTLESISMESWGVLQGLFITLFFLPPGTGAVYREVSLICETSSNDSEKHFGVFAACAQEGLQVGFRTDLSQETKQHTLNQKHHRKLESTSLHAELFRTASA